MFQIFVSKIIEKVYEKRQYINVCINMEAGAGERWASFRALRGTGPYTKVPGTKITCT